MRELGISIYPDNGSKEEIKRYISLASQYGFTRIFTCLISLKGDKNKVIEDFKDIVGHADNLDMKVIADVTPTIFEEFNISYDDLKFFKDLKLWGLRLDLGFSGMEESIMTFNPYGLKIEVNMSSGTKYLDNILSYVPNKDNLIGCHNFYPHRYTGLSRDHFMNTSMEYRKKGIRTAAFVSSSIGEYGPWKVREGLCTLEDHRNLPIETQAKDLFNTDLIDDVIIANAFASEEELRALSEMNRDLLTINIEVLADLPEIERKILLEELHFNRGDVSEYMIRSTQSRVKYKDHYFKLFNPKEIQKGDILIDSSLYDRYAGELQIALKDMKNSGKTSVVGRVVEEEIYLLDYILPWQKFKLKEKG